MLRVAIDTSVIIAAARSRRGASSLLIDWLDDGLFEAVISATLALEYEEILRREVQGVWWSAEEVTRFVDFMCSACVRIAPKASLRPCLSDPDDEFLVDLCVEGLADYLVTHNVRDFAGASAYGVKAVTPGAFLQLVRGGP